MSRVIEVRLYCEIIDPQALWRAAKAWMVANGSALPEEVDFPFSIGSEAEPNAGSCLRMLLDHSDNLAGASITESQADEDTYR